MNGTDFIIMLTHKIQRQYKTRDSKTKSS